MKKFIILLLSVLFLLSLTACSASQEGKEINSVSSNSKEAAELNLPEEFKPFECSAEDEINYETVEGRLKEYRQKSVEYLKKGIER